MKSKGKKQTVKSNGFAKKPSKSVHTEQDEGTDDDTSDQLGQESSGDDEIEVQDDDAEESSLDGDDGGDELSQEGDGDDGGDELSQEGDGDDDDDGNISTDDDWLESTQHKKALSNLQNTDPEFYQFLQENDKKLLQFQESDSDEGDDEDKLHVPPDELEGDSEESDYEVEGGEKKDKNVVTLSMLKQWREDLVSNPSSQSINKVMELFHAALDRVIGEDTSVYKVEGSAVFNTVIEMCVMNLQPAIVNFLKLTPTSIKNPEKSKRWVKVKSSLQLYFKDLFKLLEGVASEHIMTVMLKHLHSFCSFVACFPKLSKLAVKNLTRLWSTGEETVRVLAYLCILRLTTLQKSSLLNTALKHMYIAYIHGCKFVSATTLPQINFMKQTLVDMYSLDPQLSYEHAFLYIRQLAIHLRNAITIHKKESFQTVYNWQYIHSLRLWIDLMCVSQDSPELKQLVFPLVQIILGCVKLIPTAQYIPLRFHCIQMLIKLGRETSIYIPVMPLILESLSKANLNKQMKKASMKPFDFTFVLRLSKSAMTETAFTDAVVEYVFQLLIEACASYSHMIGSPDLFIPVIIQLKTFLKDCTIPKYSSKLKQALVKIEENSKLIDSKRSKLTLNLHETEKIKAFETEMKANGTPLQKYWEEVRKSSAITRAKQATKNEKIAKDGMPEMLKIKRRTKTKSEDEGPAELFPSDESDFEFPDIDNPDDKVKKQKKKEKKKVSKKESNESLVKEEDDMDFEDEEDLVEELDLNKF
ncbi:nucleolar complex protein 2 homolog isoform X2 [Cimex lectularius]|uniref:Nucleolar complex protein 2 homolog n=1 Tax=Cimex lectularius TaxID=79782 RepID=A0A8I6SNH2_CIMLE|nr:nucleolar complex protein 2 homolog isoform X2 [Cimex lectularius]